MNIHIEGLPQDSEEKPTRMYVPPGCATFGRESSVEILYDN